MGLSVHDSLESVQSSIDALGELVSSDIRKIARLMLAYRVEISRADAKITAALGKCSERDSYLIAQNALQVLESVAHDLELGVQSELGSALAHINSAIDFVRERSALETHHLSDPIVRRQVMDLTGGKCAYCAIDLKDGGGEADQFCIEHVVPASKGGPNHLSNYVPSCRSCNNSKGDRHVLYFIQNSFVLRQRVTP